MIGRICVRSVVTTEADEPLATAARRMDEHAVGCLVVVDGKKHPVGILTDRDLMLHCVARGHDAGSEQVAQAMSAPVVTAREEMPIENAISQLSAASIRRLPVVDASGALVGLLALDDVLDLLSEEVATIGRLLSRRARG